MSDSERLWHSVPTQSRRGESIQTLQRTAALRASAAELMIAAPERIVMQPQVLCRLAIRCCRRARCAARSSVPVERAAELMIRSAPRRTEWTPWQEVCG